MNKVVYSFSVSYSESCVKVVVVFISRSILGYVGSIEWISRKIIGNKCVYLINVFKSCC